MTLGINHSMEVLFLCLVSKDLKVVVQSYPIIETKDYFTGKKTYWTTHQNKGPVGTKVTLTVKHLGQDVAEDITVNRDRITSPELAEYEKRLKAYKAHKPWRE